MAVYQLLPACKDYLWGGRRLKDYYKKNTAFDILAETWELSCYPDAPSIITNGPHAGQPLNVLMAPERKEQILGTRCAAYDDFPVLVKLIDSAQPLSIQVHPDDAYARAHGEPFGKNEMWYILHAEPDAFLYLGFREEIPEEEFRARIENGTLTDVLNRVPVKAGDAFLIPAGTLHAIGAGITLAEIQQNSNATYRVYDFKRKDKDGKERPLHIADALAVTARVPYRAQPDAHPHLAACHPFLVDRLFLDGKLLKEARGEVDETSFLHLLVTEGSGELRTREETVAFARGDSLLLSAGSGEYGVRTSASCDMLLTTLAG